MRSDAVKGPPDKDIIILFGRVFAAPETFDLITLNIKLLCISRFCLPKPTPSYDNVLWNKQKLHFSDIGNKIVF